MRRRGGSPRPVLRPRALAALAALLAVGPAVALPARAAAQQPARPDTATPTPAGAAAPAGSQDTARGRAFLGGYALLAHDPSTGQIGAVAASSTFSAGSGLLAVEFGAGAVAVLGRRSPAARRAALEALRGGAGAGEATTRAMAAAGRPPGLQVTVLTPACTRSTRTADGAWSWTGVVEGQDGRLCFTAAGALLADSAVAQRLARGFRTADGTLLERLRAGLSAAEGGAGEMARSRSAALWISAPDAASGALGRADLRLQVEDVQRPADALRAVLRSGRADHLAHRASRAVDAGRHQQAVKLAERAVEQDPATALAWMAKGRALLYRGEDARAEEAFRRMLEIDPHLLHLLGDPSAAVRDTADGGARGAPEVRRELIPYRPRLILRLDAYRRAFHKGVDFPDREAGGGQGGTDQGGTGPADAERGARGPADESGGAGQGPKGAAEDGRGPAP